MKKHVLKRILRWRPARLAATALVGLAAFGCAAGPSGPMDRPWPTYLHDDARTNTTDAVLTVPMKKAWDADVGDYRFFYPLPDQELSTPALYGGVVYAGGSEGELTALDPATGRAHWSFETGVPLEAPPAVTEERVCFGSSNGVVRCLERESGEEVFSFQARSEVVTSPVIRDGRLYFASSDDKVHALDLEAGGEVWTHSHESGSLGDILSGSEPLDEQTVAEGLMDAPPGRRTPVVIDGRVYATGPEGSVMALSADTGETLGVYNMIPARDFIVTPGRTFVLAGEERVVAVDRLSGAILWDRELEFGPVSQVLATRNHLVMISNRTTKILGLDFLSRTKGHIQILDLETGEPAWDKKLSSSVSSGASASDDILALITDEGDVTVYGPK